MADIAANIGPWVAILALALGIINTIAQWVGRPGKELKSSIECLEDETATRFKDHDRRIQKLEDGAPHLPTKQDLHGLEVAIAKFGTKLEGLSHTVDRMDRHLMEQGK